MDQILDAFTVLVSTPWVYLVVGVVAGLDSLVPVVPAETLLVSAAALSAGGEPSLVGLGLAGAAGALVGDLATHGVGRGTGRLATRLTARPRVRRAVTSARAGFSRRGGSALIVGRFVPGGRTATTLTSGVLRYPVRAFLCHDAIGCLLWAAYSVAIGRLGAQLVEDSPLLGVGIGIAIALVLSGLVELIRRMRSRQPSDGSMSSLGREFQRPDVIASIAPARDTLSNSTAGNRPVVK